MFENQRENQRPHQQELQVEKRAAREHEVNHFSTTGRCIGPAHYDVSIRQAATERHS